MSTIKINGNFKKIILPIPQGIREVPANFYEINNVKKALLISDIHIPFQDNRAIETALSYTDFDTLILNGDVFDFGSVSRFLKNPTLPEVLDELEIGRKFFEYLRQKFPKKRIIFYTGNHDDRLKNYVMDKAPLLFKVATRLLKTELNLDKLRIEFLENGQGWKVGKLYGIHGNEAGLGGGINVSRNMLIRSFDNVIFGHFHKTNSSSTRNLSGHNFMSWSVGCLCDLYPKYRPRMGTWNLGFATIEIHKDKFEVQNKMIDSNDYSVY